MNATLAQAKRIGILRTPLGDDTLALVRFEGHEALGDLFEFRIDALSLDRDLDFDGAIGQSCSVTFSAYDTERVFNGILVEAEWLGPSNDNFAYRLVLRPWFWLLSKTTDCRIFEQMDVKEIIKKVFSDRGLSDFEDKTTSSYPKIDYCVQYRETDMNFVCRMMEQFGIFYYFEHASSTHTLVMADAKSSLKPVPGLDSVAFVDLDGSDRANEQHLYEWTASRRFRTGKIELNDYDYLKPSAKMLSDAKGTASYARSGMEVYDYPGRYKETSDGDRFAKVQLEAEQALDQRRLAAGDAISLLPGGLVTLEKHIKPSENVQYLVVRASHDFVTESYRSGAGSLPDRVYRGTYEFQPSDRPFRSPPVTPRPFVHGPQTAKVVGKSGEEIDVDEHGRILVQFYWDRKKMQSCRVRIAQIYSGKTWGGIFIPRIDQEVVVEFLEGDPDRPLVTGTVYNGDNKVPYALPDNKTKGGWKTESSKGHDGYNELVFEDKKGSEQIGVHAQKDLDLVILNAETREVGARFVPPMGSPSRSTTLKNGDDQLTLDMGNQTISISIGNQTISVGQAITASAFLSITSSVGLSSVSITPAAISDTAPVINVTGMATVNVTAPVITLTGVVNVVGLLTVNGLVPMLLPV